jgi:cytochrome c-type protein NapC
MRLLKNLNMKILGIGTLGVAAVSFVVGILFWGGFNTAMEATNSLWFCTSCHEMNDYVFPDYEKSIHYKNQYGVRAICSDCHVPHPWIYKLIRKVQASGEVYHKIVGTIGTPEKFEAHRMELAEHVWKVMKETDSRECRNCHNWTAMDVEKQPPRARESHLTGIKDGSTCIDCHKGVMDPKAAEQAKKEAPAPTSFDLE